jgi:ABC-type phosphate transport system substrate-binding protein
MTMSKHTESFVGAVLLSSTLLVATAAAPEEARRWQLLKEALGDAPALAQGGDLPETFSVPNELPADARLRVDGSTSMAVTNEALRDRFLERFPEAEVELDASRTDAALEELLAGDLDVVATGRPLTEAERGQGLAEVAIDREKLAIIVGPQNTFEGSLTFEQFAQIFRGEITDWAEVGGAPGPIRLVDRPDYSDTRRALSTYEVFRGAPFQTGATADPVDDDTTDAVVSTLDSDGIGYAVVSQVADRSDVRILPMHQTLPDDPRYPYSQHRAYVYNAQNPSPAALAFLGFVTTAPGQEIAEATAIAAPTAEATPAPDAEPAATPDQETALVPPAGTATETAPARRFPWWLLGIPLLGGLLWWLLKGRGGPVAAPVAAPLPVATAAPSRIILTPRNCRRAYAYWEVPEGAKADQRDRGGRDLMVRLFDVTDAAPSEDGDLAQSHHLPTCLEQYPVGEDQQDLHLPIPTDDRDYLVELGYVSGEGHWLPLAKSDPVRVPACVPEEEPSATPGEETNLGNVALAGGAALGAAVIGAGLLGRNRDTAAPSPAAPPPSAMTLAARSGQKAYANWWDVPATAKAAARSQGGSQHQLRIYDVTGDGGAAIDIDRQLARSVLTYAIDEADSDREVPIPQGDRDYLAEVGYATEDGRWLALARSAPVRIAEIGAAAVPAAGVVGAALAGAAMATTPAATAPAPAGGRAGTCAIAEAIVHSRHNAVLLDGGQMHHLQEQVAATYVLDPGSYILRIKDGVFNYADPSHPGEPWVLLWIYGGKVQNLKTGVWVDGTWSTLNGYADTLSLEVDEPAKLCAFFIDTFPENNTDAVTLSVVRL